MVRMPSSTDSLCVSHKAEDRQHSGRYGREHKVEEQIRLGTQGKKQKAEHQIGQGKVINLALGEGIGLICVMPAKKIGLP